MMKEKIIADLKKSINKVKPKADLIAFSNVNWDEIKIKYNK